MNDIWNGYEKDTKHLAPTKYKAKNILKMAEKVKNKQTNKQTFLT